MDNQISALVANGVERGMFPALTTVRCRMFDYRKPFLFKLFKSNVSVAMCHDYEIRYYWFSLFNISVTFTNIIIMFKI